MSSLASPRSRLAVVLVSCIALAFAACGGTSVQHVSDDAGGAGGTGQGATGGASSGSGGTTAATGGTTAATGGTTAATGGTTAATGGTTAATGGSGSLTCEGILKETQAELARIQSCGADAECGQVLTGTSCGCTRDLVARLDADAARFDALYHATVDGVQCNAFGSTCDCPKADGFVCAKGRCAWNYVNDDPPPMCTPATMGTMCIVGTAIDSGDALLVGAPLTLTFQPAGCYSSSCTKVLTSSCDLKQDMNDFYVVASMCLTQNADPNVGCTADCGGGGQLTCPTKYLLTEGTHTVHYSGDSSLDLTFTVPSVVNDGSLCATMDHLR